MRFTQVIFSPTGGTAKAADLLCSKWQGEMRKADLSDPQGSYKSCEFNEDDFALIAVPSFGGRVPALAAERLRELKGNHARCALLCVYGNRAYEDTLAELKDLAEECGFEVQAAVAAIAEHSIAHDIAAGRPDSEDAKELADFSERILNEVINGDRDRLSHASLSVPGNHPYKEGSGDPGPFPAAGEKCTGCGICARECPVQAIDKADPHKLDESKCISCMRCTVVCPEGARSLDPKVVGFVSEMLKKAGACERKSNELYIAG